MPVAPREGALPPARAGGQTMAVPLAESHHEQVTSHGQQSQAEKRRRSVSELLIYSSIEECFLLDSASFPDTLCCGTKHSAEMPHSLCTTCLLTWYLG